MTPVPDAKHGVKCRYCELSARMYVFDTDGYKSPVCADHARKRTYLVNHPTAGDPEVAKLEVCPHCNVDLPSHEFHCIKNGGTLDLTQAKL